MVELRFKPIWEHILESRYHFRYLQKWTKHTIHVPHGANILMLYCRRESGAETTVRFREITAPPSQRNLGNLLPYWVVISQTVRMPRCFLRWSLSFGDISSTLLKLMRICFKMSYKSFICYKKKTSSKGKNARFCIPCPGSNMNTYISAANRLN